MIMIMKMMMMIKYNFKQVVSDTAAPTLVVTMIVVLE